MRVDIEGRIMDTDALDKLRLLVTEFRRACEEYAQRTDDVFFRHFPKYCCGYASEMLECYLMENGFKNLRHVIGEELGSQATHAWSKIEENLIVDITLDQFSESLPPVYIGVPLPIHNKYEYTRERDSDSKIENFTVYCFYSSICHIIEKAKKQQQAFHSTFLDEKQ